MAVLHLMGTPLVQLQGDLTYEQEQFLLHALPTAYVFVHEISSGLVPLPPPRQSANAVAQEQLLDRMERRAAAAAERSA